MKAHRPPTATLAAKTPGSGRRRGGESLNSSFHESFRGNGASPLLVAIVGGSGAGKTWLAEKLRNALSPDATLLALDDFYRDRSHLSADRRAKLNFDHPNAIDWPCFETVLRACRAGRTVRVPQYDFSTHRRRPDWRAFQPKPIILVEGLWLLRRKSLRRLFDWRIYVEAPTALRLRRRLLRDQKQRGRTPASVRTQFRQTVQPMHQRFVAPQARWANVVVRGTAKPPAIRALLNQLRQARIPAVSIPD